MVGEWIVVTDRCGLWDLIFFVSLESSVLRFTPECEHGANAGLAKARAILEPIKAKFPWISYADLWTLAGVVSVEAMGGESVGGWEVSWTPSLTYGR